MINNLEIIQEFPRVARRHYERTLEGAKVIDQVFDAGRHGGEGTYVPSPFSSDAENIFTKSTRGFMKYLHQSFFLQPLQFYSHFV